MLAETQTKIKCPNFPIKDGSTESKYLSRIDSPSKNSSAGQWIHHLDCRNARYSLQLQCFPQLFAKTKSPSIREIKYTGSQTIWRSGLHDRTTHCKSGLEICPSPQKPILHELACSFREIFKSELETCHVPKFHHASSNNSTITIGMEHINTMDAHCLTRAHTH